MTILNIFNGFNIKHLYILSLILVYFFGFILFYRKIFGDPELKKFFLDSLRESNGNNKPSGKSLTAFLLSNIISIATIVAIIYSPNHILPEFYLISILTFVGSLYGISMASKYFTGGNGKTIETPVTETEEEKKKKNNPDDIG